MNTKALIIDGHNFLFRGYYGVPAQVKFTDGTKINAIYGFFSFLRAALRKVSPEYLVIVFDSETSSDIKKSLMPEYKANRVVQDEDIFDQLTLIKRCLDILKIYWVEDVSNEADDVIGSYAKNFVKAHASVFICSNDHDFIQLVQDDISIVRSSKGENTVLNSIDVLNKYGVLPERYLDYLTLVGDKSDNIAGIKGVGKKYAIQMISDYGDVTNICRSINLLSPSLKKKMFGQERTLIDLKDFLMINTELPLPSTFTISKCLLKDDLLPEKMGAFLHNHWQEISS